MNCIIKIKNAWLLLSCMGTVAAHAQMTGFNTKDPKYTADVNGTMRVRTLPNGPGWPSNNNNATTPRTGRIITHEAEGQLKMVPSSIDVVLTAGVYVKQTVPNQWNMLYLGNKAARLDFVGNTSDNVSFCFSVLYAKGGGFAGIPTYTNAEPTAPVPAITGVDATSFNVKLDAEDFVFTISHTDNDWGDVRVTNSNSKTIKGTFVSAAQF